MGKPTGNVKGIYLRGEVWYIDACFRGQRLRQAIGPDKQQAIDALALWKGRVIDGAYFPNRAARSLTVTDVLNAYWEEHLKYQKYGRTFKFNLTVVDRFLGTMLVRDLTELDVQRFIRERRSQISNHGTQISETTIHHQIGVLLSALRHCAKRSKTCRLVNNPLENVSRPRKAEPKRIVFDDGAANGPEWQALYAALHPRLKPVVLGLYESAMRPAEIFGLRWSWIEEISPQHWLVNVPADAEKTGRGRSIPVSAAWLESLKALPRTDDGLVYKSRMGRGWKSIREGFNAAVERAGLRPELTPYALRRTRITIWDTIDSTAGREAAGHSPIDVHARHYVRISRQRLFKLVGIELEMRQEYRLIGSG